MAAVARGIAQAVVLAGGRGARLHPLTATMPKPMLPLLGRPLLSYLLDELETAGTARAVLACGYRADAVTAHFGDSYGRMSLDYRVEPEPRGTAGAVRFAADGIDEAFLAVNGDSLWEFDVGELLAFHRRQGAAATLQVARVPDPLRYGLVTVRPGGRVEAFLEKPDRSGASPPGLVSVGVYVLEPQALELIPPTRPASLERDLFPVLATRGELFALELSGYWLDVGTPESYLQAHLDLLARRGLDVHETARVDPDAVLSAPVAIEAGARVGRGAVVGPLACVGLGAQVGDRAEIASTAVLPGATVEAGCRLTHALVAPSVTLRIS